MPRSGSVRGHKRRFGKKRRYKRPRGTRAMARRAALEVLNTRISGLAGLEKKYLDCTVSGAPVVFNTTSLSGSGIIGPTAVSGAAVTPVVLNAPAQGDGPSQRDGRQINMESLYIVGNILCLNDPNVGTAPEAMPAVTVWIIMDTQTNAAAASVTDFFEANTFPASSNLSNCVLMNMANAKRFRVLKKMRFDARDFQSIGSSFNDTDNTFGASGSTVHFEEYIKLGGKSVNFISGETTSSVAAIADNSIYLVAYRSGTSEDDETSQAVQISYVSRLRFMG